MFDDFLSTPLVDSYYGFTPAVTTTISGFVMHSTYMLYANNSNSNFLNVIRRSSLFLVINENNLIISSDRMHLRFVLVELLYHKIGGYRAQSEVKNVIWW